MVSAYEPLLLRQAALCGGVLFRGFPSANLAHLDFGLAPFEGTDSAAVRKRVGHHVWTANEAPASQPIPFHHELAQSAHRPSHLLFHCVLPAHKGGATLFTDSRKLASYVRQAHPAMAALLDDGISYRRVMPVRDDSGSPIGRSWRTTFGTSSRSEVERLLRASRMEWAWRPDGALWTQTPPRPAFRHHPETGTFAFYNSILAVYEGWHDVRNDGTQSVVTAADEKVLPPAFIESVRSRAHAQAYAHRWRQGDVLLLDNSVTMHAREPFWGDRTLHVKLLA